MQLAVAHAARHLADHKSKQIGIATFARLSARRSLLPSPQHVALPQVLPSMRVYAVDAFGNVIVLGAVGGAGYQSLATPPSVAAYAGVTQAIVYSIVPNAATQSPPESGALELEPKQPAWMAAHGPSMVGGLSEHQFDSLHFTQVIQSPTEVEHIGCAKSCMLSATHIA